VEQSGPVSYVIELVDGQIIKRHAIQLLRRDEGCIKPRRESLSLEMEITHQEVGYQPLSQRASHQQPKHRTIQLLNQLQRVLLFHQLPVLLFHPLPVPLFHPLPQYFDNQREPPRACPQRDTELYKHSE
jgi:hypothetical protein